MAVTSKDRYPTALPFLSPEELASKAAKLAERNDQLAAESKRLGRWKEELAGKSARLRWWTLRLLGVSVIILLLAGAAVVCVINQASVASLPTLANPSPETPEGEQAKVAQGNSEAKETKNPTTTASPKTETSPHQSLPTVRAKRAPSVLPTNAISKPDGGRVNAKIASADSNQKADFLEALGGLSAAHLYQSHLNIGLLADGVESGTYTVAEAEKNLKAVLDLMKLVDRQLAKLGKSELDPDDQESIKQMQAVTTVLRLQGDSLMAHWATGKREHANQYHEARKATWKGVSKVLGLDN